MKRWLAMLISVVCLLSLTACGGKQTASAEETPKEEKANAGVEVEERLLTVDVTLPASFFEDQTEDEIRAGAKENGYIACEVHADGSVTYTMSRQKHAEMLDALKTRFDELIAGCMEGENAAASFVDIQCNDDFSKIDIYVDAEQYTMWDNLYAMTFYVAGAYYQAFSGVAYDDVDVLVNFIDNATGEVLNTASYRDFRNNMASGDDAEGSDNDARAASAAALAEGETVSIADTCEFHIDYITVTQDVMPPQPGSWYSHYQAESGKMYVDLCIAYKNLSARDRSADEILNATLTYAGKYQYSGFSVIEEDNRGNFTYANITSIAPLSEEYLHYLFEVPAEVGTGEGALTILLNVDGNAYCVTAREGIEGEVGAISENAVAKTGGAVKNGEVIAVADQCEFFVDHSNITDDVLPPQPGSWYSHYEADAGKVYVDFCVGYKNWKQKAIGADDAMSALLTYAGKYEYTGFSMIEKDSRGDFTYSNITGIAPLCTEYLHYLFEVPSEVESSSEKIEIEFTIAGNTYTYQVR